MYALGILRDDLGLDDSMLDDEKITKKIEEILTNSNNESKKEKLSLLTYFYNYPIKELQQKFKTCEIIKIIMKND